MKFTTSGQFDKMISLLKKAGRTGVAVLLIVAMLASALPMGSGAYLAYAESDVAVSGTDGAQSDVIQPDDMAEVSGSDASAAQNINVVLPLMSPESTSGSDVSSADVSSSDIIEEHICVIRGFEGYTPGFALDVINAASTAELKALLPGTLTGIIDCEDCTDAIDVEWELSGGVYRAVLDAKRYSYVVEDDPETRDIDESCTSPWCDLPYIEFTVPADEIASGSDVSGRPIVPSENISITVPVSGSDVVSDSDAVSGSDVFGSDVSASDVSASDVSGSDVSGSDVSGSDVFGSDAVPGKPTGSITVSGTDIGGESQVLPLCTCRSHCYADADNGQYVVDIHCAVCSADPAACLVAPDMPERVLEFTAGDGRLITVTGPLPEGAELSVEPVAHDEALQMLGENTGLAEANICFAYDIRIIYEGQAFQPGDYGNNVTVNIHSVGAMQAESLEVYHITEGAAEAVEVDVDEESVASFETDGFSVFVGTTEYTHPQFTAVYVWRSSGSDDAGHYFTLSAAEKGDTSKALRKTSNGTHYHRIQELINDYCPVGGTLTIYTVDTYCTNGTETIDGTGKNITIKQYAGHARNVINVIGGTLTLKNVTVDAAYTVNKTYDYDATVLVNAGKTLIMEDGVVLKDGSSHAVFLNGSGATFTMNGGVISGHKAPNGSTYAGITGSEASDTVDANGAAVYVRSGATFNMNGGEITGNTANDSGGAIWLEGTMTMTDGKITNNTATRLEGGGIIITGGGRMTMSGGEISGNKAGNCGGGINVHGSGTLTVNGGKISGNTAVNAGGAIYNNNKTVTINGGEISGNTAGTQGGGIYTSGALTVNGGRIVDNSAAKEGGGIFVTGSGETKIMGTTEISGNTSPNSTGKDGGDGICTANSGDTNPHLLMTGSPLITDVVSLGFAGNVANNDISIYGTFTPRAVINIALRAGTIKVGEEVVTTLKSYTNSTTYATRNATDADLANFAMVDPRLYLYYGTTEPYQLKIGMTDNIAYYSKNGTGNGSTPDSPTNSMVTAYERLKTKGGTIFMLTDFEPTSDVTLTGKSITYEGTTTSVTGNGSIVIKRYSKQSGYSAASNTADSLITVKDGVTVTLSSITVDGHNRRLENSLAGANVTAEPLSSVSKASVAVNGGKLNVSGYTRFKDSPASPMGGAIYVEGSGAVDISGNVIFDNATSGAGEVIFVNSNNSAVTLGGTVTLGEGDIHLETAGAKINIASGFTAKNENANNHIDVTLSDDASKTGAPGRIIAHYLSGSPDYTKYTVSNSLVSAFEIENRADNVILKAEDIVTLTAAPADVELDAGKIKSFDIDLTELFNSAVLAANTSVSISATATGVTLVDYAEVDSNAAKWGTNDAGSRFGLDADGTDISGTVSLSYASDKVLTVTLHNANAITENKEKVGTVTLTLSVGGYVSMYTVYIDTQGGTICVTVPLKITGTVDAMGEFTLPTPEAYKITNKSSFPVEVTNISWAWESGASKLFADVGAMSAEVLLGSNPDKLTFAGSTLSHSITNGKIAAVDTLGLAWDMLIGDGNYILLKSTEHVATITYTIGIVE